MPGGGIETTLKLETQYESSGQVIQSIFDCDGDIKKLRNEIKSKRISFSGSVKKLYKAYEEIANFLEKNFSGENEISDLEEFWDHLSKDIVFIQISTDVGTALKVFETINDRGVSLDAMDLLKNLLFSHVKKDEFSRLKDEWKKMTSPLEKNKVKNLRFLRYFLMAKYKIGKTRQEEIIYEDEIFSWFKKPLNIEQTSYKEDAFGFISVVKENVDHYIDFKDNNGNDGRPSIAIESLKALTGSSFSLHYVLLLAVAKLPRQLFVQFAYQLESFMFYYIFTKTTSKYLERNFSVWADKLRKIVDLRELDKQREALNTFLVEHFANDIAKKEKELINYLNELSLDNCPKYRIRYFLARIAQHLDMAIDGKKQRDSLKRYLDLEIEHILPRNPNSELLREWEEKYPDLGYASYVEYVGNLTLLGSTMNKIAGNDFYSSKVRNYKDSSIYLTKSLVSLADGGKNSSISRVNDFLKPYETWDREDIDDRQNRLVKLALEVWKITEIKA